MNVYEEVRRFYEGWRGEKRVVGYSAEGRELFAVFAGKRGGAVGISQAAMHAREWITALLTLEQTVRGVSGGVWFIPLVNPDGALIVQEGLASVSSRKTRKFLLSLSSEDGFPLWKANARGVDLNVNFPARWGEGASNLRAPAPANYIGKFPLCAPESRALAAFTRRVSPDYTLSWHTKGEEIYWRFHQPPERAARDGRYGEIVSKSTGYPLAEAPRSAGGYKDWCVETLGIPAFTVEAGRDELFHPLGGEALGEIVKRCGNAVKDLSEGFAWKNGS